MFRLFPAAHQVEVKGIEVLTFPDGQPHVKVPVHSVKYEPLLIKGPIASATDLFMLQLLVDVLRHQGYDRLEFTCTYLMGARMDRRIDRRQPFTLKVVADVINKLRFEKIWLFDPHSDVAPALVDRSEVILPVRQVNQVADSINTSVNPAGLDGHTILVIPDAGAVKRCEKLNPGWPTVQFLKRRDTQTGKLSGFHLDCADSDIKGRDCLIVDDICDGGGTFVAEAQQLKALGAKWVGLYVSHGIFSKGLLLDSIDYIWYAHHPNDAHIMYSDGAAATCLGV